jgi:hypothetical protein
MKWILIWGLLICVFFVACEVIYSFLAGIHGIVGIFILIPIGIALTNFLLFHIKKVYLSINSNHSTTMLKCFCVIFSSFFLAFAFSIMLYTNRTYESNLYELLNDKDYAIHIHISPINAESTRLSIFKDCINDSRYGFLFMVILALIFAKNSSRRDPSV